ncbi:MAG: hypothetical protein ACXADB_13730, partial [Candidatus Hermodarchaeia archaeon]
MSSIQIGIHQKPFRLFFQRERVNLLTLSTPDAAIEVDRTGKTYRFSFEKSTLELELFHNGVIFKWEGQEIINRIAMDGHWFGMGSLIHQRWPLNRLMIPLSDLVTSDSGATGLSTLVSPTWLTHRGLTLIVKSSVKVGVNQPPHNLDKRNADIPGEYIPFDQRPWFDRDLIGDGQLTLVGDDLHFEVSFSEDLISAYDEMVEVMGRPRKTPPLKLMEAP